MSDPTTMPPVEGAECCILEICCGGEKQEKMLAEKIAAAKLAGINDHAAYLVAEWIIEHYDLAGKGTLVPLKRHISALARAYEPDPGY